MKTIYDVISMDTAISEAHYSRDLGNNIGSCTKLVTGRPICRKVG